MNSTLLLLPFSAPYPPYYKEDALMSEFRHLKVLLFDAIKDPALMRANLADIFPVLFKLRIKQMIRQAEGKSVPSMGDIEQYYSNISHIERSKGLLDLALSVEFSYRTFTKIVKGFDEDQTEGGNEIIIKILGLFDFHEFSILLGLFMPDGVSAILKDIMMIELGVILLDELSNGKVEINESSLEEMAIIVNESTREFGVLSKQLELSKKRGSGRPLEYLPVSEQDIKDQKAWAEAGMESYANALN